MSAKTAAVHLTTLASLAVQNHRHLTYNSLTISHAFEPGVPLVCPSKKNGLIALRRLAPPLFNCETLFDCDAKAAQVKAIDDQMAAPDFWNDQEAAQAKVAEKKSLVSVLSPLEEAKSASEELDLTIEMAAEDDELASEVPDQVNKLEADIEALKLKALLNG